MTVGPHHFAHGRLAQESHHHRRHHRQFESVDILRHEFQLLAFAIQSFLLLLGYQQSRLRKSQPVFQNCLSRIYVNYSNDNLSQNYYNGD